MPFLGPRTGTLAPFGNLKQANIRIGPLATRPPFPKVIGLMEMIVHQVTSNSNEYLISLIEFILKNRRYISCTYSSLRFKNHLKYHSFENDERGHVFVVSRGEEKRRRRISSDRIENRIGRGERKGKGWIPPLVNGNPPYTAYKRIPPMASGSLIYRVRG